MSKERLYLFDTTLRDGAQTTGVDFSIEDKRRIAAVLDELGVDYVEGGFPGANATDTQFLGEPSQLKGAKLTAFGMTKRAGRSVSNDPGLQAVLARAPTPSASSPSRRTITCAWPSASPTRRTSPGCSNR